MTIQIEMTDLSATASVSAGDYFWLKRGVADFRVTLANLFGWHTDDVSNPHGTTKAQVGLSNVLNAEQLTKSLNLSDLPSALTARSNLSVMSIAEVTAAILAHTNLTNNPHSVTASQVGLEKVFNGYTSHSYTSGASDTYSTSKALKDGLDALRLELQNTFFKVGDVMMYYGDANTFNRPGWAVCRGQYSAALGYNLPDFRNRFPMGGVSSGLGGGGVFYTGGTASNAHNHTIIGDNFTLQPEHLPTHSHTIGTRTVSGVGGGTIAKVAGAATATDTVTGEVGGNVAHAHTGSSLSALSATGNLPPYIEIHFIMKVS